jgi:phage terminase large subunit-like protein
LSASRNAGKLSEDLSEFTREELELILAHWPLWARDDQLAPAFAAPDEAWRVWLILGGRGAGKTRAGAEWVTAKALGRTHDGASPARRIALVGETLGDVRRVMIEGVSGILSVGLARERPQFEPSKGQITFASGAIAQVFSAEDADGLRGPQFDAAWWADQQRHHVTCLFRVEGRGADCEPHGRAEAHHGRGGARHLFAALLAARELR